jgi:hypothetical protein
VNELLLFAALGSPEPPPSFSALPPAPPPAVAAAPRPVPAAGRWVVEEWPGYGRVEVWRAAPSGVVPGVTPGPGKPAAGGTTDATAGTVVPTPPAVTSPPTTAGAPRTTAPTASRGATPTGADTGIGARVASPGGGIELFGLPPGTTVKRNPDGSTTVCPPWG